VYVCVSVCVVCSLCLSIYVCVFVCVCVCVCAYVHVCVHACVRVYTQISLGTIINHKHFELNLYVLYCLSFTLISMVQESELLLLSSAHHDCCGWHEVPHCSKDAGSMQQHLHLRIRGPCWCNCYLHHALSVVCWVPWR